MDTEALKNEDSKDDTEQSKLSDYDILKKILKQRYRIKVDGICGICQSIDNIYQAEEYAEIQSICSKCLNKAPEYMEADFTVNHDNKKFCCDFCDNYPNPNNNPWHPCRPVKESDYTYTCYQVNYLCACETCYLDCFSE